MSASGTIYDDAVKELDVNLDVNDDAYIIAKLLLASARHGTDMRILSKEIGEPLRKLKSFESRLWEQGIWDEEGVDEGDWLGEAGAAALWMDVACVQGRVNRTWDNDKKTWMFSLSDEERKRLDVLLGNQTG